MSQGPPKPICGSKVKSLLLDSEKINHRRASLREVKSRLVFRRLANAVRGDGGGCLWWFVVVVVMGVVVGGGGVGGGGGFPGSVYIPLQFSQQKHKWQIFSSSSFIQFLTFLTSVYFHLYDVCWFLLMHMYR